MPPPKRRSGGGKAAKKDAQTAKDTLFNDMKTDLDRAIRWDGMVAAKDEEGAIESLDKAAKQFYASTMTFATRPDDLQLKSTRNCPQPPRLIDYQRGHVRELYQEVQEAIQRHSEQQTPGKASDYAKDFPASEGFIKAFELNTREEQEEVSCLPKKRTPFPGGPPPEEVLDEDEEMGKSLDIQVLLRIWLAHSATVESDFEVPDIDGLINLKKLPLHSFEKMGGFKAALKR